MSHQNRMLVTKCNIKEFLASLFGKVWLPRVSCYGERYTSLFKHLGVVASSLGMNQHFGRSWSCIPISSLPQMLG